MYFQMIRVISSPSSSTTGLVTLIFAMEIGPFWNSAFRDGGDNASRAIAPPTRSRKPRRYALSAHILAQNAACVAVPATTYQVTKIPQISAPGRLEPVRRQVKVAITAHIAKKRHELDGEDGRKGTE